MKINPGDVLYDPRKDQLIVYSGWIVQDDLGQDALFFHDRDWDDMGRSCKGTIYRGWLTSHLVHVGKM